MSKYQDSRRANIPVNGQKNKDQGSKVNNGVFVYTRNMAVGELAKELNVNVNEIIKFLFLEKEMMVTAVKAIQSICDTPLQLDSTIPEVLEAGLRVYNGKPIVNSVNGEDESLENVLPLVKKYGAAVVGLTLDKNGIPKTADGRFAIAKKILELKGLSDKLEIKVKVLSIDKNNIEMLLNNKQDILKYNKIRHNLFNVGFQNNELSTIIIYDDYNYKLDFIAVFKYLRVSFFGGQL